MKTLLLIVISLLPLCGLLGVSTPPEPSASLSEDVCSENPYYAGALVALEWLGSHPYPPGTPASAYSHAVLDGLYQGLLAEGRSSLRPHPVR